MLAAKLYPALSKRLCLAHVAPDFTEADAALPPVSGIYRLDLYSSPRSAVNYESNISTDDCPKRGRAFSREVSPRSSPLKAYRLWLARSISAFDGR